MNPLVSAVVAWVSRRRRTVLAAVACLSVLSAVGAWRLSFDADVLALLPQQGRIIPGFRDFLARFGTLDRLYVVFTAADGHGIDEYGDDIDAWVEGLRQAPEIAGVETGTFDSGTDLGWLAERQLLLLDRAGLGEALRRLTPDALSAEVARSRELLAVPSRAAAELVRQDPAGLIPLLPIASARGGLPVVAGGQDGYVSEDGRRRIVIARPRLPPYDAGFTRALDDRLQAIARAQAHMRSEGALAGDEPLPPMRVEFAGGHRVALETESVVRRESIVNTLGSLVVILPLLFVVFRSPWLVTVGALPSALSLLVVLGGFGFMGTRLSAAGTGASAMLFGLGIDGVVLLYVAYLLPAGRGDTGDTASRISGPSASMLLGMWTTAATFYGLVFVDFPSLQQLGLLVGHSMVVCGVLTLVLVPALLPRRAPARGSRALTMSWLPLRVASFRWVILGAAAILTLVLGASTTRLRVNPGLERLRPATDASLLEAEIVSAFGLPADFYVVLAEGADLDALLQTNERLGERLVAELPAMGLQLPAWALPSRAAQDRAALTIRGSGLTSNGVRASLERAAAEHGFKPGVFAPFADRLPAMLDTSQRLTYDDYVSHGLGDLIARFVARTGDRWQLATYVFPSNVAEAARVQAIVDEVDPGQVLTGLPLVDRELARTFGAEFLTGLAIGGVLVVLLVLAAFRDWRLSTFALLPTFVGLAWTGGLLALAGIELDMFAAFAVVTMLGIGVDYGVHLVHRFQDLGDARTATAELAPVILVAAAITILGYGTLVTSSYPPLRSIGIVSVVSVVALAVASVLVLPALLLTQQAARRA